jgi:16S rRNA (cytosine1402-N4)-methyltransferase
MKTALQNMHLSSSPTPTTTSGDSIFGQVDAMLLDLGISSMQVDEGDRGFSLMRDGPLDMRMDPSCSTTQSAADIVNNASEAELGRIIREYGEERWWKVIAKRMVDAREDVGPLMTTGQLVEAIGRFPNSGGGGGKGKGKGQSKKGSSSSSSSSSSKGGRKAGGNIHPATRTFQALRIAVNNELGSLAQVIPDAIDALAPGGRLAVITFHSLEDRVVKWAFRKAAGMVVPTEEEEHIRGGGGGGGGYGGGHSHMLMMMEREREIMQDGGKREAVVKILTKRPILPGDDEVRENPRSRSAKLRVVEKLGGG